MSNPPDNIEAASALPCRILRSVLSIENLHSGIEIRSVAPGGDFEKAVRAKLLFDCVYRMPDNLPNIDAWMIESVFSRQAQLVVALDGPEVIGMACYHPDGERRIVIRVAVTHAPTVYPNTQRFVCSIRQMRDGKLNERSRRSFEKVGFELEPVAHVAYLDGTFTNRNKWPTAELDEIGAVYIQYRLMFSQRGTLEAARAYLQEWSNAILPIPERLRIR